MHGVSGTLVGTGHAFRNRITAQFAFVRCNMRGQEGLSALMSISARAALVAALGFCCAAGASTISPTIAVRNTPIMVVTREQNESKIKTFTGVIAKKGDEFILADDSKSNYQLDDQQTAERFVGKKV